MSDSLNPQDILDILPHRFPFLMIDRVVEVGEDRVVAIKNVSFGEPYFQGHFPGAPVMPGVLQVEAMAQTAGIMAAQDTGYDRETQVVLFMTIDGVKFRRPVVPGDQLRIEVEPLRRGKIWKFKGQATVDGQVACQAEFMATMAPRPGANSAS